MLIAMRSSTFAAILLPTLVAAGSCSFPEVIFEGSGGTSTNTANASTSSTAVVDGGGLGGMASASGTAGGSGGQGGGGFGGGVGGQGGVSCADPDVDDDEHASIECMGDDCDDNDQYVFKGQIEYFGTSNLKGTFDYDCDGIATPEFVTVPCEGALCTETMNVFLGQPSPCGTPGVFGTCTTFCEKQPSGVKTVRCR